MACPTTEYDGFRHYRRPSIRAKFQTHRKKSEEDLKEALRSADQQQQNVLQSTSSWQSACSKCENGLTIGKAQAVIRRQSKKLRSSWLSTSSYSLTDLEQMAPSPEPHAAQCSGLSSPSIPHAQSMTCWPDEKPELQPIARLERKPARREVHRLEKDKRKEQKEEKKAQKTKEKHERKELRRKVTEARAGNATANRHVLPEIDGVGPDTHRSASTNTWKRPLLKLSTHSRRNKQIIPMPGIIPTPGDFLSKSHLEAYLNPVADSPAIPEPAIPEIPELPAGPPPYNPLESSDLPDPNKALQPAEFATSRENHTGYRPHPINHQQLDEASFKPMICDSCYSGIGLSDVYYHCDKCNGGDRILCSLCCEAGRRCRHELFARVSSVKRDPVLSLDSAIPLTRPSTTNSREEFLSPATASLKTSDRPSLAMSEEPISPGGDQVYAAANADMQSFEAFQRVVGMLRDMKIQDGHSKPVKCPEVPQVQHKERIHSTPKTQESILQREHELALRERAVVTREQEAAMRERESALREQQASLREREVAFAQRSAPIAMTADTSQEDTRQVVRQVVMEMLAGPEPQIHLDTHNAQIRTHAGTKRKATESSHSRESSSATLHSGWTPAKDDRTNDSYEEEDEDDDEGTPKRRKQSTAGPVTTSQQRLLACPYAKCDPIRYSERNVLEKQYRGCSGRYLTDISRLKQHLYRVHQRPEHACPRCFEVFKSKELLDIHARQRILCQVSECRFSEKFTEDEMKKLKRKRPGKSVEEAWYIIFKILFPEAEAPDSPYVDDLGVSLDVPSGPETQTSNLLEIFNEQLSQHQHTEALSGLTREARDLINQTLAQSMAELLRRISPSNTPSIGRTPSIFISPTSAQPRSNLQTPASSIPPSPLSPSNSRKNVPWLSPLQTTHTTKAVETRQDEAVATASPEQFPRRRQHIPVQKMPSPIEEDQPQLVVEAEVPPGSPDLVLPEIEDFERYLGRDHYGYDDTIGLAISEFDFGFQGPAFDTSQRAASSPGSDSGSNFVPVKVSSLDDLPADELEGGENNGNTTRTCSKRSLDSGYGSMNERDREAAGIVKTVPTGEDGFDGDLAYLNEGLYETLAGNYAGAVDLDIGMDYRRSY